MSKKRAVPFKCTTVDAFTIIVLARSPKGAASVAETHGHKVQRLGMHWAAVEVDESHRTHAINAPVI